MNPAAFPPPDPSTVAPEEPAVVSTGGWPAPHQAFEPQPSVDAPYSSLLYLPDPRVRWGLPTAVLTIAGIVLPLAVLIVLFGLGVLPYSPALAFAGAFGSYLIGLVVPVLASRLRGLKSLARDYGLTFRWIDVPIGIGLGIAVRIVIVLVLIGFSPFLQEAQGNLALEPDPVWFVLSSVVIPVVIAPIVEEILCRGVVMRAVRNRMLRTKAEAAPPTHGRRVWAAVFSIVASTLVFALLHGHQMVNPATIVTLGVTTVVAGLAHGWIATATGRLGAAIISHATLNGSAVLLLVLVTALG
ncbi:CPBP family intramembrane metalloprotease [Rathayibacter caricis]|uniref:CPBP family intramembrane glutamic endopeptidase n=1 Tax=Rathayibacter caricis TaxID=110936 RepID=UPI001FB3D2F1|nr:type II CAAX endopeptidase family protein [Rathayibacter caricis]MCJ1697433.1 CPBP family intramembrane metalloprotease [Rathayibacter caricis]